MTQLPRAARRRQSAPEQAPARPSALPAQRPSAWAVQSRRLRAAATTEPGRLQIIGAVLALLVLAFGAVTALEISHRSAAADDVVGRSQPLSADAANIYRSPPTRTRWRPAASSRGPRSRRRRGRVPQGHRGSGRLLVKASANTDASTSSWQEITTLNELLPVYTGLIESGRASNRQGLPLGGAYLRYANQKMTNERAARRRAAVRGGDGPARRVPADALAVALPLARRRNRGAGRAGVDAAPHYRRTNRVFNHGLLVATAAASVVLLWLAVGHTGPAPSCGPR
ncbi:Secreted protein OS=Streptomyces microflavus OX=1919 GN=Smic_24820 PE=4 SV=1 [Streptomyces microflavus]